MKEGRYPQGYRPLKPPMRMTKQELTEHTIAVWQQRTARRVSQEDTREITENLTGFFTILAEWSHKECHRRKTEASDCTNVHTSRRLEV